MPEENLTAKITVDTSQVAGAVAKAKQELNKLKDKTVNVKVKVGASSSGGGKSAKGGNNTNLGALGKQAEKASWGLSSVADSSKKAAKSTERASATMGELAQTVRTLRSALERFRNALNDANKSAKTAIRHRKKAEAAANANEPEKSDTENSAEEEKKKQKEALAVNRAQIKETRNLIKSLAAVVAAARLVRDAYKKLESVLGTPAGYYAAGEMSGIGAERIQQWKWALTPYGGGDAGGIADMLAIQRNLEAMGRGENPFGNAAMVNLGGRALAYRPGMTQEDFIDQIAPALQSLSLEKAMASGRDLGLSDSMILFLRKFGAEWKEEVDRQRKIFSQKQAEYSAEAQVGFKQTSDAADEFLNKYATALGKWLKENPNIQALIGGGGTVLSALFRIIEILLMLRLLNFVIRRFPPMGGGGSGGGGGGGGGGGTPIVPPGISPEVNEEPEKDKETSPESVSAPAMSPTLAPEILPGVTAPNPFAMHSQREKEKLKYRVTHSGAPEGVNLKDKFVKDLTNSLIAWGAAAVAALAPQALPYLIPAAGAAAAAAPAAAAAGEKNKIKIKGKSVTHSGAPEGNYPTLPADTPLNHMDNASARQLGAAAGRGETSVDVGGVVININAPTGDAEDIQNAVARGTGGAAEIMRQQLEELDREFASPYYA